MSARARTLQESDSPAREGGGREGKRAAEGPGPGEREICDWEQACSFYATLVPCLNLLPQLAMPRFRDDSRVADGPAGGGRTRDRLTKSLSGCGTVERMHRGTFHLRGTLDVCLRLAPTSEGRVVYCFHVHKAPTLTYLVFGDLRMHRAAAHAFANGPQDAQAQTSNLCWVPCSCERPTVCGPRPPPVCNAVRIRNTQDLSLHKA